MQAELEESVATALEDLSPFMGEGRLGTLEAIRRVRRASERQAIRIR